MGCDIHAAVEVKITPFESFPEASWWVMAGEVHIDRNYSMFAALAGVRADQVNDRGESITPIAEPRGLPADASNPMRAWHQEWDEDAHSTSWMTVEDLVGYTDFDFSNLINEIDNREGPYNAIASRLVFFFDN